MSALKSLSVPHVDAVLVDLICDQAREVVDTVQEFDASEGPRKKRLFGTVTKRLDSLLGSLMAIDGDFIEEEAQSIFARNFRITYDDLASLNPSIIPLAVMREMISTYQVPVDRTNLANWKAFEERYIGAVCH